MREYRQFTATLLAALILSWLLSGDRFLDAAFEMVDLGRFDDMVIAGVVVLEEWKASLGFPDAFSATRAALHSGFGLE